MPPFDYLNPALPAALARVTMPVVDASDSNLAGYGRLPYYVPLALPGDDVKPAQFVCFRFDSSRGLNIHPNLWHEGVFARRGMQCFFDKQRAVHARVSIDFAREFGCLLEAVLT